MHYIVNMEMSRVNTKNGYYIYYDKGARAMSHNLSASWGWLIKKLGTQFVTGIIAVVPIGATIGILYWIFVAIDNVLQPLIKAIWGHTSPNSTASWLLCKVIRTV